MGSDFASRTRSPGLTRRIRIGERTWLIEVRSVSGGWATLRFELADGPVLNRRRRIVWRGVHLATGRWNGGGERAVCRRWAPELERALPDIARLFDLTERPAA